VLSGLSVQKVSATRMPFLQLASGCCQPHITRRWLAADVHLFDAASQRRVN
jgi:hypothetical protein